MKETVIVIGGCRSGKSRHALEMAEKIAGKEKFFIATLVGRGTRSIGSDLRLRLPKKR